MSLTKSSQAHVVLCCTTLVVLALVSDITARSLCWKPRPQAECQWCLVTEIGYGRILTDGYDPVPKFYGERTGRWRLFSELGLVKNIRQELGVGVTVAGEGRDNMVFFAVKPRVRLWKGRNVALELGVGPVFYESNDALRLRGLPMTGHVGVQLFGLTTISLQADYWPVVVSYYDYEIAGPDNSHYISYNDHLSDLSAGISMNSYLFPVGAGSLLIVSVIAVIVIMTALSGTEECEKSGGRNGLRL